MARSDKIVSFCQRHRDGAQSLRAAYDRPVHHAAAPLRLRRARGREVAAPPAGRAREDVRAVWG